MSEKLTSDSGEQHHDRAKLAAEIGGLAAVSAGAVMLWRKRRKEARTFHEIRKSTDLVFEDPRIPEEHRELLAKLAVRIYHATISSGNGTVSLHALTSDLGAKRTDAVHMLAYLLPEKHATEEGRAQAFIDTRKGSVHDERGYFAQPRLIQLVEEGGSDLVDQANFEMMHGSPELVIYDFEAFEEQPEQAPHAESA